MTRRLPSQSKPILKLAAVFLLATFLTSIISMTPSEVQARRIESLSMPGGGGNPNVVPDGQGDDDQPTSDGEGGLRSTLALSEPDPGGGGDSDIRFRSLRIVKKLIVRSGSFIGRLVGFIP